VDIYAYLPVRPQSVCNTDTTTEADFTNTDKEVKFTLEQTMKAQRGSRGIALLFL